MPWPYQCPTVQRSTRADGLFDLHPIGLGSVPTRRRALCSHTTVLCHPTPLTPPASVLQPVAMGREAGWLSKSGVRRGRASAWAHTGNGRRQGRCSWRRINTSDSRGLRDELNTSIRIHSTWSIYNISLWWPSGHGLGKSRRQIAENAFHFPLGWVIAQPWPQADVCFRHLWRLLAPWWWTSCTTSSLAFLTCKN